MTDWVILEALGVGIAVLLLAWTSLLYVPLRWWPVGRYLWVPKLTAGAFTPFIAAAGLLLALVGGLVGSWWLAVPAGLAAPRAAIVVVRLGRVRADLAPPLAPTGPTASPANLGPGWWAAGGGGGCPPSPSRGCARTSPSRPCRAAVARCCATCGSPQPACLRRGWPWSTCTAASGAPLTRTPGPGCCFATWP